MFVRGANLVYCLLKPAPIIGKFLSPAAAGAALLVAE